jgi:hypothetical protein
MNSSLPTASSEKPISTANEAYENWFREKVQEALDNPKTTLSHQQAMALVQSQLSTLRATHAPGALE